MKQVVHLLLVLICLCAGCSSLQRSGVSIPGTIRIKGSDSMLLLVQKLAERYMSEHPEKHITVEGGGSGVGVQSLIKGMCDICATSRPLTPEEVKMIAQKYQSLGVSILCAKDALSIVVHPSNPVADLSLEQVKSVFTGTITNWSSFGLTAATITAYRRESNSGTYLYFEDHVLSGEGYAPACITVPGAAALIERVAADPSGIGYSTAVYHNGVKRISVNGIAPSPENVRNGTYPITRYLYLYTVHPPDGELRSFIDWVIGKEGQRTVKENGYVPLYETD